MAHRNTRERTVGGAYGHWVRRAIHISSAIIPVLYYWYGTPWAAALAMTRYQLVSVIVLAILVIELIRLWLGKTVFGQRDYEASYLSAFAWSTFGIGIVLLVAPQMGNHGAALGIPLIWSLSFGDPVLGEMRNYRASKMTMAIAATITVATIWLFSWWWLGTPWWLTIIMAPLTVAAEWPRLRWINDNATMLLIPLAAVVLLSPWF